MLIAVFAVGAASVVWYEQGDDKKPVATTEVKKKTTPQDPLTIAAIRARSYPGSAITVERDIGVMNGYHEQIISYKSDGLIIRALRDTPTGSPPAGGWPVIILDHGYINPAQYQTAGSDYRSYIATFTGAGYMVVKPDFRGHGTSEGVAEGGHFSPVYTYDQLNLLASLKQDSTVNAARIGQFGHSMGGHVALRTTVVSKDIKATVLMAPVVGSFNDLFYSWPHSPAPNDQPRAITTGKREELVAKYGDPKQNPDFWNSVSAINYVEAVTGPIQINHDADDSTVPKLFSDHLADALTKAHKSVEYYVYPGDDHQFSRSRSLLLERALAFYKIHL